MIGERDVDINEIKGGQLYQLLALRWDRQTSKPGEPFTFRRYRRGDLIGKGSEKAKNGEPTDPTDLLLSEDEARRLVAADAIAIPGSIEKAQAERAAKQLQAALNQVPDDVRAELLRQLGGSETGEQTPPPDRPSDKASKAVWVEYDVALGADRSESEKLSRDDLVAKHPVE